MIQITQAALGAYVSLKRGGPTSLAMFAIAAVAFTNEGVHLMRLREQNRLDRLALVIAVIEADPKNDHKHDPTTGECIHE